jgi:hypothetical protein
MADPIHAFEADGTPSPGAQTALSQKSNVGHTHTQAQVDGLDDRLNTIAADTVALVGGVEGRLDGIEDAINDTGWVAVPLAEGFSHYGAPGPAPQVRRIGAVVYLRGRLTRDADKFITGTGYTVLTLPSEFRPAFNGRFVLGGGTTTHWGRAEVVASSGDIGFAAISGDLVWVDLGGMNWTID